MEALSEISAARRGRWAVAALFFINGFIVGSWAAQIPAYIKRLDISEAVFALLILGFGLGAVMSMPCAGLVMARVGSRPVVLPLASAAVFGQPRRLVLCRCTSASASRARSAASRTPGRSRRGCSGSVTSVDATGPGSDTGRRSVRRRSRPSVARQRPIGASDQVASGCNDAIPVTGDYSHLSPIHFAHPGKRPRHHDECSPGP